MSSSSSPTSQASQLILPLKVPIKTDIKKVFMNWLDEPPSFEAIENPNAHVGIKPVFFSKDCYSDLTRLQSLRNCLCDSISKSISHKHALEERALFDLCEYHATVLDFLAHSFPDANDETLPTLELTWKAGVGPQRETHHGLSFERIGCLWNLAALESYIVITECNTTTKEGRKEAVQHSQRAASYLRVLREDVIAQPGNYIQYDTVDYCSQHLELWETAYKAQAQRCAYEMATLSGGNPKILAMLAIAAAPIYNDALRLSQDARLVSELPRPMQDVGTHCKAWSLYLQARAPWHQAQAMRAAKEWGLEIAQCKQAMTEIEACREFCKSSGGVVSQEFSNNVESTYRHVKDRLEQAEQDNLLYGEEVPSILEPIRPHAMAAKSDLPLPPDCLKSQVVLFKNIPKP